jgi:HSP20 family protein
VNITVSNRDIISNDWYKRFFSGLSPFGSWNFDDMFREFDEMRNEMERAFSEPFKNIEKRVLKDLVREYETSEGRKVREVGPIVYNRS